MIFLLFVLKAFLLHGHQQTNSVLWEKGGKHNLHQIFFPQSNLKVFYLNMLVHCWMSKVDFVASLPLAVIRKSAFLSYRQKVLIHLDSLRLQLFLLKTSRVIILLLKNS